MESCIYTGFVTHRRFTPLRHFFSYKTFSILFDLDELDELNKKINFFSLNSFNLFSFYNEDHGERNGSDLKDWVNKSLKKYNISLDISKIKLLCFPRIFGYVFNPLSVFYCYEGDKLKVILYEVKNTFNEQHTYIFLVDENAKIISQNCNKKFYVSPFIEMEARYKFFNKMEKDKININIELFDKNNKKVITASQYGKFINFNSKNMLKFIYFNPLLGFKVMLGILYEAVKIVFKGGKYVPRIKKLNDTVSFEGNF